MPRKKKYASDAERLRAYRERKRREQESQPGVAEKVAEKSEHPEATPESPPVEPLPVRVESVVEPQPRKVASESEPLEAAFMLGYEGKPCPWDPHLVSFRSPQFKLMEAWTRGVWQRQAELTALERKTDMAQKPSLQKALKEQVQKTKNPWDG
jgi:hypothetical protein